MSEVTGISSAVPAAVPSTSQTVSAAITSWGDAHVQQEEGEFSLGSAISSLNGMPTDQKYMLLVMLIMPAAMNDREGRVVTSSAELNISSALSAIVTNITTDINGIKASNTTPAGSGSTPAPGSNLAYAQNLVQECNKLSAVLGTPSATWHNPRTGQEETKPWIDAQTLSTVTSSLSSLGSLIDTSDTSGTTAMNNILSWTSNPTSGSPSGQTQMQALHAAKTTMENAFGGISQMANNKVQFDTTLVTAVTKAAQAMGQSAVNLTKGLVQNERVS